MNREIFEQVNASFKSRSKTKGQNQMCIPEVNWRVKSNDVAENGVTFLHIKFDDVSLHLDRFAFTAFRVGVMN